MSVVTLQSIKQTFLWGGAGLLLIGLIGGVIVTNRLSKLSYTPALSHASTHVSSLYSERSRETITQWIDQYLSKHPVTPFTVARFLTQLQNNHPEIASASADFYTPGVLSCSITGARPQFWVNKSHIAGDTGKLYSPNMFDLYPHKERLPYITVSSEWAREERSADLVQFFKQVPEPLFACRKIIYKDPYTILFLPKRSAQLPYGVVALVDEQSVTRIPDETILNELCLYAQKKYPSDWKKGSAFLFDFRFDERVISKIITIKELQAIEKEGE